MSHIKVGSCEVAGSVRLAPTPTIPNVRTKKMRIVDLDNKSIIGIIVKQGVRNGSLTREESSCVRECEKCEGMGVKE